MRYVNKITGAVLDSSFNISGGDWINEELNVKEDIPEKNTPEENKPVEIDAQPENDEAFEGITRAQIMQELDAFGIEYDKRANKQVLYDLMMNHGK